MANKRQGSLEGRFLGRLHVSEEAWVLLLLQSLHPVKADLASPNSSGSVEGRR